MPRDFVLEDHECMASVRLAELAKAVDRIRLGRGLHGDVLGAFGIESGRDAANRRCQIVVYRVADGESVCLVDIPDRGKPTIELPGPDGAGWEAAE